MSEQILENASVHGQQIRYRPIPITVVSILVFGISAASLYRLGWYLLNPGLVWSNITPARIWYLLNSSLTIGLIWIPIGQALWRGMPLARPLFVGGMLLNTILFWVEKFLVSANDTAWVDWRFALVLNLLLAGSVLGILFSPQAEAFFTKEEK